MLLYQLIYLYKYIYLAQDKTLFFCNLSLRDMLMLLINSKYD